MDILLFKHEKFEQSYNCSFIDLSKLPKDALKHEFLGVVVLMSYALFFLLYCLCLWAMLSTHHRNKASYRLMILLGCIHIVGLQFSGLATALLAIEGAVYCSHPIWIYLCGAFGLATWCGSTLTSMILGLNRCCELYGGQMPQRVFGGFRLYFWIGLICAYMFYVLMYTPPPLYSGFLMAWFFNPFTGIHNDYGVQYHNAVHSTNNFIVCSTESMLYTTLILLYLRATKSISMEMKNAFKREKKIYIQVVLIGIIHFTASFCYVLMQFIPVNFYTTLMASTFYLLSQGFPPVIYLLVNRTLRNLVMAKLGLKKRHQIAMLSTGQQKSQAGTAIGPARTSTKTKFESSC